MVNVKVHDKLSGFVTFVGDTPEASHVKVVRKTVDAQGEVIDTTELVQGKDYESVTINSGEGTIDLDFGNTDKALEDHVYELSFDIKLKDDVEITAGDKSIGDKNTDFDPENNISSGKSGVKTNEEAYFTFGEDETTKVLYPHPVIPASAAYTPGHQKYIKDNKDGTYNLTLNVTSTQESNEETITKSVPADIIFIMDKSSSMKRTMYSDEKEGWDKSRAKAVNDAMDLILNKLSDIESVSFGSCRFDGDAEPFSGWKKGEDARKLKFNDLNDLGSGTKPSGALEIALEEMKKEERKDHNKYFIFLTDGSPNDNDDETSVNIAKTYQTEVPGSKFYAINIRSDKTKQFMSDITRAANGLGAQESTDGYLFQANDKNGLNEAMDKIADEIYTTVTNSTSGVTSVSITDTLSQYAEFAFGTENLENTDEVKVVRKSADGTETELGKDEYTINVTEKTITLSLTKVNSESGKENELEKDVTYSITFPVRPTQEAKDKYQQDGGYYRDPNGNKREEPFTGDEGTDAPDNDTSFGKPGFPTNERAYITYTYDGAISTKDYDHPVLQVPQTGQFVVQKLVTIEDNETPLADVKFIINLEKTNAEGSQDVPFSSVALKNEEISPVVKTEGEAQFKISEAVPMEYSLTGIEVFQKAAGEKPETDVTDDRWNDTNKVLTVKPGDDLIVKVTNNLAHEGYFHSVDQVTNWTNGKPGTPFTSDKTPAREAAESQPKADTGKKNKKVAEMEEEEGDPLV